MGESREEGEIVNLPNGFWYRKPLNQNVKPATEMVLNKGDKATLKHSNRRFEIIDERKDETGAFEELCKFDDDSRHPVWIHHTELAGEVKDVKTAEPETPYGGL